MTISFGDNVRVRSDPATTALGIDGLVGQVYGETMPSKIDVNVIGQLETDHAFNVYIQARNQAYWFAPELLELVDHAPGTEITIDGVPKKFVRSANGDWESVPSAKKPWWKFW
jgi:hypothetical protein